MCVDKVGAEEIMPNQGESNDQVTEILCGLSLNSLRELVEFATCQDQLHWAHEQADL